MSTQPPAPILPGATLGVLGSGQLGRMFAAEAALLGYRVQTYSPDTDSPTGQIAVKEWTAPYDDLQRVRAFAEAVDVVTFEFENVPAQTAATCAAQCPVRPAGEVLHIIQNRSREKGFLRQHGFPVTPFRDVRGLDDLVAAVAALGAPAVLKTAAFGYDGKGQVKIAGDSHQELEAAWAAMNGAPAILEAFIDFRLEISVVGARGLDGDMAFFPVFENAHANHILDVTVCPARISPALADRAREVAAGVLEALDVIGVLCVEFFVTADEQVLINELAPRPHNSGHLTLDACHASQFNQQVRAITGMPLGDPGLLQPAAAMANLLGDLWAAGEPNWAAVLALPGVHLHLYGKAQARPGRKMGHLTCTAATPDAAEALVRRARALLTAKT